MLAAKSRLQGRYKCHEPGMLLMALCRIAFSLGSSVWIWELTWLNARTFEKAKSIAPVRERRSMTRSQHRVSKHELCNSDLSSNPRLARILHAHIGWGKMPAWPSETAG